jgi:hypothetical protein
LSIFWLVLLESGFFALKLQFHDDLKRRLYSERGDRTGRQILQFCFTMFSKETSQVHIPYFFFVRLPCPLLHACMTALCSLSLIMLVIYKWITQYMSQYDYLLGRYSWSPYEVMRRPCQYILCYIFIFIYVYGNIYIEREREREMEQ